MRALPLLLLAAVPSAAWKHVSIEDFGAVGDNKTDNTVAVRAALKAVAAGGEVLVPAGGVYQTAPFNITSNVVFRVEGHIRGVEDYTKFPNLPKPVSYPFDYDTQHASVQDRKHPLVFVDFADNATITGSGVIDGAGAYWWLANGNWGIIGNVGRPHLMEVHSATNFVLEGVTLLNSGFWCLHPWNSTNVHIHHTKILAPSLTECKAYPRGCNNMDGIDVDSCTNVLIEDNYISVNDDHVTILSGREAPGKAFATPSKNITVRNNRLGHGMGLSVGSSVSGGIEDVLYQGNWMNETAHEWGQGMHIKSRITFGGYVRNVTWADNYFLHAGNPGGAIEIESGYQSHGNCTASGENACTKVSDITFRNITVAHPGGLGSLQGYAEAPVENLVFENVHVNTKGPWHCKYVASGSAKDVTPPGLAEACGWKN